jgi:CBS domain containing-hemolysin-like protein
MILFIFAVILALVALAAITLRKTYTYLPPKELKRQARSGDQLAAVLYRAAAYGPNLRLLLWIIIGLSAAGSFSILARLAPAGLGFIAIALVLVYGFAWLPSGKLTSFGARLAAWLTPTIVWLLVKLHPLLRLAVRILGRHREHVEHSGMYEVDDIVDLLQNQKNQLDSRIAPSTIDILLHTLAYGDMSVSDVLVPRHAVVSVHTDDTVGPILMDELYDSGHNRFPVLDANEEMVGVLHLHDLVEKTHGGKVSEVMQTNLRYIHEDHSLEQALHAMLSTGRPLLLVVNSKQEYVGIISIEDVIEQVLGHKLTSEFDQYDSKAAVAAHTTLPVVVPDEVADDVPDESLQISQEVVE